MIDEAARQAVERRPGDDAVERPFAGKPVGAVGLPDEGVGDGKRLEALARLLGQRLVALDRDDPAASRAMTAAE